MDKQFLISELKASREFLNRSTRPLGDEQANFRPSPDQMTAAQQMAHVGQSIEWFLEGAFNGGFSLDFDAHAKELEQTKTMTAARERVAKAFDDAIKTIESKSDADLDAKLPEGPVMGGEPTWKIFPAIVEHTAHHRGALTVYSRLQGLQPPMPYADM